MIEIHLPELSATTRFAAALADLITAPQLIYLQGDLGAGKSTLARAFIQHLTSPQTEVPSPTFTLVQTYNTAKGEVWHYDLYRLKHAEEVWELGFEDALHSGIVLVEWPERLSGLPLPAPLIITLRHEGDERLATIQGPEEINELLLNLAEKFS